MSYRVNLCGVCVTSYSYYSVYILTCVVFTLRRIYYLRYVVCALTYAVFGVHYCVVFYSVHQTVYVIRSVFMYHGCCVVVSKPHFLQHIKERYTDSSIAKLVFRATISIIFNACVFTKYKMCRVGI